jgi:hypothetical protein
MIDDRFGCELHESPIRQLYHIKQAKFQTMLIVLLNLLINYLHMRLILFLCTILLVLWMDCGMKFVQLS